MAKNDAFSFIYIEITSAQNFCTESVESRLVSSNFEHS